MQVKFIRLDPNLPTPHYSHFDDAGFDLYTREEVTLAPGARAMVPTGLKMEIPEGYVGLIWDKSGLAMKHGLKMLGGVDDANYRGEVHVGVINLGQEPYTFLKYHKVAQMLIQKKETAEFVEVTDLNDSERGEKAFGSSGK